MVPIDLNDGVFMLAVTHLDDKISNQPHLQNPEMDGSPNLVSARIPLAPSGASQCIKHHQARGSWASLQLIVVAHLTRLDSSMQLFLSCPWNLPFSPRLAGVSNIFAILELMSCPMQVSLGSE
jgi:hypothetical protein